MKRLTLSLLVIINIVLLAGAMERFALTGPVASAQNQAGVRRPGDYIMIPADTVAGGSGIVYVLDSTNGRLAAIAYNESTRKIDTNMRRIDLVQLFREYETSATPTRRR